VVTAVKHSYHFSDSAYHCLLYCFILDFGRIVPNRHGGGAKQAVYQDVQHYFKINFFFPLLDLLTNDISNRFSENDLDIL